MLDGLRTIACYVLVGSILGGLWSYAALRQRVSLEERLMLPPADPALLQRVRELAANEDWKDQQQKRASPTRGATVITRVENGE